MRAVTSNRLSLVLPSLPADSPGFLQQVQDYASHAGEPFNLLRKILARADTINPPTTDRHALIYFLLSGELQSSPPVAALRALADGLEPADEEYWLCADPVHLHADLDHLLLFSGESFAPTPGQAAELVKALNQLFHEDGFDFIVGTPEHWYLRCSTVPEVSFTALDKVQGRNILPFMPSGIAAADWRRYLNEMQMQMTACTVNQQRLESGMPAVNSIWCWGGGDLPACSKSAVNRIYTEQAFSRGLARHLQVDALPLPGSAEHILFDTPEQLIEFPELVEPDDPQAFVTFLARFEHDYLAPLSMAIKQGKLGELVIYFADQRFTVSRRTQRRCWRRLRSLAGLSC